MDWVLFPKGVLLGISIAAPVGPIGLLTIRRTINDGFRMGVATGLGAATADTVYGVIAAFGLTAVMSALTGHADIIRVIGGLALLVIGIRGVVAMRRSQGEGSVARVDSVTTPIGSYIQTLGLTLTNPMTILTFIALFAGAGIADDAEVTSAIALVVGVAVGSSLWWLCLSGFVSRIRHRLSSRAIRIINLGSSIIIIGFGVIALISSVR